MRRKGNVKEWEFRNGKREQYYTDFKRSVRLIIGQYKSGKSSSKQSDTEFVSDLH